MTVTREDLLHAGGLFAEREPEDPFADDIDDPTRDAWESMACHVVRFDRAGTFVHFRWTTYNRGDSYELREGTYELRGTRLTLSLRARLFWSAGDWATEPQRIAQHLSEERDVLVASTELGPAFELDGRTFLPIRNCPISASACDDGGAELELRIGECRARARATE